MAGGTNEFSTGRNVLHGAFAGGGVAVQLLRSTNPAGLILDRTFSSTVDIGANRYWFLPVRMVMRNQFPSASWIRQYDGRCSRCMVTAIA